MPKKFMVDKKEQNIGEPDKKSGHSLRAFIHGKITYDNEDTADLIYIKTTLVNGLPEDIYGYHRSNPDFPDQTTMDQFFDERHFEAYRELGFRIGQLLGKKFKNEKLEDLFKNQKEKPKNSKKKS